jgi:hypothetical protein
MTILYEKCIYSSVCMTIGTFRKKEGKEIKRYLSIILCYQTCMYK